MTTKELSFDQAMERLQEVVSLLDSPTLSLEESIALFEEGLKLSAQCNAQLKEFEKKVKSIVSEYETKEDNVNETTT